MRAPTFAPAYVALFPALAEIAHEHGYALAIHGSVSRDFDLVAIPWTDAAGSAFDLMRAIAARVRAVMGARDGHGVPHYAAAAKPHGRLAWSIPMGKQHCGAAIDLSVVARGGTHETNSDKSLKAIYSADNLLFRALAYVDDEARKYADDGNNEPGVLAQEIRDALLMSE